MSTFVALSDTHGLHNQIREEDMSVADFLIHAGDFLSFGTAIELASFSHWLEGHMHKYKHVILVAGNHDRLFETDYHLAKSLLPEGVHYLQDSGVELEGIKFWGSPWTNAFNNWAFQLHTPEQSKEVWSRIPEGIDVLITHGPPYGYLDKDDNGTHLGSKELLEWSTKNVERMLPSTWLWGHIHRDGGLSCVIERGSRDLLCVGSNLSLLGEDYKMTRKPLTGTL